MNFHRLHIPTGIVMRRDDTWHTPNTMFWENTKNIVVYKSSSKPSHSFQLFFHSQTTYKINKVDTPNSKTTRIWTYVVVWHMAIRGSRNGHQNNECAQEIGLHA